VARAAWDPRGGEVVLVGGLVGSDVVRETWSWDGRAWARGTALAPPRFLHGLAYDSKRGGLVLFGGHVNAGDPSPAGSVGETWSNERGAWTSAAVPGPSARDHVNLACDETRHRVVLYGGIEAGGFAADTWEWDGAAWHAIADAGGPGARANASLVYDRRGHRVLLYGGFAESGPTNDLWAWNGTKWTSLE
jgi:hypothetical protein